jgi:hypothetical protein
MMKLRSAILWIGIFAGFVCDCRCADAAAVVLENRTTQKVEFSIQWPGGKDSRHVLVAGDIRPIAVTGPIGIVFEADGRSHRYRLQANGIYIFVRRDDRLELTGLALPKMGPVGSSSAPPCPALPSKETDSVCTIPIKILADDQEPTVRAVWEKRLRERIEAASDIFERCCRVRFNVVAVDTWTADPGDTEFEQAVAKFERLVSPSPGRIAIGFTGHFKWDPSEKHVGGIRGPLRSHILIREALVRVSEPERLEVLVHELGHYLGAAHSAESTSVMRPTLGDRQSCLRGFRIGFDAPNTLAMYLIAEEYGRRPIRSLQELSPETKMPLRGIYAWLMRALPEDPAAPRYLSLVDVPIRTGP